MICWDLHHDSLLHNVCRLLYAQAQNRNCCSLQTLSSGWLRWWKGMYIELPVTVLPKNCWENAKSRVQHANTNIKWKQGSIYIQQAGVCETSVNAVLQ